MNLDKVIFMLKHSVKLRHYLFCTSAAACHGMGRVFYAVQNATHVVFCTAALRQNCQRFVLEVERCISAVSSVVQMCVVTKVGD